MGKCRSDMKRKKRKQCFTAPQCSCAECPNIQCDAIEERYDIPASDAGLERIKCKDCHYNTGKCEDCLFRFDKKECPEVQNG